MGRPGDLLELARPVVSFMLISCLSLSPFLWIENIQILNFIYCGQNLTHTFWREWGVKSDSGAGL